MKNSEIIIATFFIIESIIICYFFYVYSNNEKTNKIQRENELKELQNLIFNKITETEKKQDVKNTENINNQEIKLKEISKQLHEKFEQLGKDVKIFQEQANSKINLGFEQLQKENAKAKKDLEVQYAIVYEDDERRAGQFTKVSDDFIDLYDETDSLYTGTKYITTVVAYLKG